MLRVFFNVNLAFCVMKKHERLLPDALEIAWGESLILSALHQIWTCSFYLLGKCPDHLGMIYSLDSAGSHLPPTLLKSS